MSRIPPSEKLAQLGESLRRGNDAEDLAGQLVRLGAQRTIQEMLEQEVTELLGRNRYERRPDRGSGYRNGYKRRRLDCAEGRLEVHLPQLRGTSRRARLWDAIKGRTDTLERLIVEMYARGLSTRDVQDTLTKLASGKEGPLLSRSSVSRVTESLWEEYEAFSQRSLAQYDVVYLFADAVYETLRRHSGASEAILVTWGIQRDGSKVLVHMGLGNKESHADWLEHFRDLVRRGLKTPLTVTTDGAPGLIKAVEAIWPESERIRCWFHKMSNILDKVPDQARNELKAYLEAVRDAPDYVQGKVRAEEVLAVLEREYPTAAKCLREDLEASLAHLKLPVLHRRHIRTTNAVERSFEEERRRSKVIPKFRSEKECLKLVYSVLWRASEHWRAVRFSEHERKQLAHYIEARNRVKLSGDQGTATTRIAGA